MNTEQKHTPEELGRWVVTNMLPPEEAARAEGIANRVASIVRAERACRGPMGAAEIAPDTLDELRQCATMIRTWIPESFPANSSGQVHFVRGVMESVAFVIERALSEAGQAATPDYVTVLKEAKDTLAYVQRVAPGYDWNADPQSLTLRTGETFSKIDAAIAMTSHRSKP